MRMRIFGDSELQEDSVIRKFRITALMSIFKIKLAKQCLANSKNQMNYSEFADGSNLYITKTDVRKS